MTKRELDEKAAEAEIGQLQYENDEQRHQIQWMREEIEGLTEALGSVGRELRDCRIHRRRI